MRNVVQVWKISLRVLEDTLGQYYGCLSQAEQDRANRFHFPDDRRRFIVARGSLRHLLARQLAQLPSAIDFCYGEYGKPAIELGAMTQWPSSQAGELHFNLSHSGELALCALSYQGPVGIDIEKVKPISRLEGMMARCLSAGEQKQVQAEALADQSRVFCSTGLVRRLI